MEVISSKRFLLLTLVTSSLLTPTFCADELMMSKLHSKENYDKYSEVSFFFNSNVIGINYTVVQV